MKAKRLPLIALCALLAGFGVSYIGVSVHHGQLLWPHWLRTSEASAQRALLRGVETEADEDATSYPLQELRILNRAVLHIKENYVDPVRINERKMVGAAMEELQRAVAELLVEVVRDEQKIPTAVTVRIGERQETFDLTGVNGLWHMSFKFKDIFRFIQRALPNHDALRDIEYAAISGMLSTLDPHSALLRPEDYREMKLSTRGKFGGLGIVISLRDGHLTVINPIEDSPASRAGIKAGDRIVQIAEDSTVSMALSDAVDLMRGEPGTQIDIWILREGWARPRRFQLERADIKVKSVAYRALKGHVGWVKLRNFQNTTSRELDDAIEKMQGKKGALKGLILDLRGNPGGLLDQAIRIADRFIESGPIVTTVGYGDKLREPKMATRMSTLSKLPIVVLIDRASASASEIVAGALKNHERALVLGQQSFGKGSVQIIYDNHDHSALKLTIAQYLTPGDRSIQSVGVSPDIETSPVTLTEARADLFGAGHRRRTEADLPEHLDHAMAEQSKAEKPRYSLRYLQPEVAEDEKTAHRDEQDLQPDFEVELAQRILSGAKTEQLSGLLGVAKQAVAEEQTRQAQAIEAALAERGVDWRALPPLSEKAPKPQGQVSLELEGPHQPPVAGDTLTLVATVQNTGASPFHRLRAVTRSDNRRLDGYELIFGNVPPGESRSWSVPIKLPRSALSRRDDLTLEFFAEGETPEAQALQVEVQQLLRPRLALSWRVDDREKGNGDGALQPQEEAELVVTVRNVGPGKAFGLTGQLRDESKADRQIFMRRGRMRHEQPLAPGEEVELRFAFAVKESATGALPLVLSVSDPELREGSSEKISLQILPVGQGVAPFEGVLSATSGAPVPIFGLYQGGAEAPIATAGAVRADGQVEGWYRVPMADGLFGWVDGQGASPQAQAQAGALTPLPLKAPPVIQLAPASLRTHTDEAQLVLAGEVHGERPLKDLLIYVNNKKVFFQPSDPQHAQRMAFSTRLALEPGVNQIALVARHDETAASQHSLIVRREAPAAQAAQAPAP